MPQSLLVSRLAVLEAPSNALPSAGDIRLTNRRQDSPCGQVPVQGKEALQVHVQVLADGAAVGVPAADFVCKAEGQGVHGGRGADGGAGVQARHACGAPEDVGDADDGGDEVGVAVENDGRRVERGGGGFGVRQAHGVDQLKIVCG